MSKKAMILLSVINLFFSFTLGSVTIINDSQFIVQFAYTEKDSFSGELIKRLNPKDEIKIQGPQFSFWAIFINAGKKDTCISFSSLGLIFDDNWVIKIFEKENGYIEYFIDKDQSEQGDSKIAQPVEAELGVYFETDEQGNVIARFTSKATLEDYLNLKTENKIWEKTKPVPGTNMNDFMAKHPLFIFEAQTRFALVKEMAQEFWDAFLEKLPGNTFSSDQLVTLIKAVGDEVYAARITKEKDPSVHFMINMQTQAQTAGFVNIFLETKKKNSCI